MSEQEQDIWKVISSVLDGNPTIEEKHRLNIWLKKGEGNKKFYETILKIQKSKEEFSEEDKKRVFEKIQKSVLHKPKIHKINIWAYTAVASISILVTMAIFNLFFRQPNSVGLTYIEAKTPFGIKSKITLCDGTVVYLNSGSILKYPAKFADKQRQVFLNGEAYFEVSKDSKHPFIVQADRINVKVYGTHFNIRAYCDDNTIETTLLEGSVGIYKKSEENEKQIVKLAPNQQAVYNGNTGKIAVKEIDGNIAIGWREGKYYFENKKLAYIANVLERNFNVTIRLTSRELENEVFYGLIAKNKNIYQLLDVIKTHNHFNYTVKNDTIYMHKN